jgi:DNA polymerase III alpha subunit
MLHKYTVRTLFTILFLLSFLLQVQLSPAAEKVSVQEILSNPDKYDGQEVSVQGKASKIEPRTSKKGNEYMTFTLRDESGKGMNIFTFGHPTISDEQKVTVTGIYQKVKRVGKYTFYNEVEAKTIQ